MKKTPLDGQPGSLFGGRFIWIEELQTWLNPFHIESIHEEDSRQTVTMRSGERWELTYGRLHVKPIERHVHGGED